MTVSIFGRSRKTFPLYLRAWNRIEIHHGPSKGRKVRMFIDQKLYAVFVIKEADHCWCQWQVNNVLRDQRSNGHLEAAHQPKEWASSSWWSHQSRDHYKRWELLSQKIYFIDPPACYIRHIWFYGLRILGISKEQTPWCIFDKPESKTQVQSPSPKSNRKGKEEFGLWAVSKILWATTTPPITFKNEGGL